MASQGQLFGAIGGLVLGFIFGNPMMGMSIGGMLGLWLDPPDPPDPDPLGDLGVNSYVRDMPVPVCFGREKVYGGVIYLGKNWAEVDNDGSSKQPQWCTVFNAEFAVALSEGQIRSIEEYYLNNNKLSELEEEDHISLTMHPHHGTSVEGIEPDILAFLSGKSAPAIPWLNTAYVYCNGSIGKQNALPTFSAIIKGLCSEDDTAIEGNESQDNWESNPINAAYQFLTNKRWGCGFPTSIFDGDPSVADSGSWRVEKEFCDALVDNGNGVMEPRFRYSNVFTNKAKGYDILRDILQTCRGFIYYSEGKIKVKIEKHDEQAVFYFSDGYEQNYEVGENSTKSRIFADFSDLPVGFFEGDIGRITIYDESIPTGFCEYTFTVITQTATHIDLADQLPVRPTSGVDTFFILKENIIKDSFTFKRKATRDISNRIRLEFINADDEFRSDYVEVDNTQNIVETDEVREQTVSMTGIKRKSQAARIATYLSDYSNYVDYSIELQTDIVGYMFDVGNIIGVHSNITDWGIKYFRIVSMEELDDYNVKLSCLEYVSNIFHDLASPYEDTDSYSLPDFYAKPDNVDRFAIIEDTVYNRVYFTFRRGSGPNNNYWQQALIYMQNGSNWKLVCNAGIPSPSVELLGNIDESATTIPYDDSSMYDSFPASGSFWIGEEEISYIGIDDINCQFTGCGRGFNNTEASSHSDNDLIILRKDNTPFYEYNINSEVGGRINFKAISVSCFDIYSDTDLAPIASVDINGWAIRPYKPSSLMINDLPGCTELVSGDVDIDWRLVTKGINKGYGYGYGYGAGYGGGDPEGILKYILRIYKKSDNTLLRTQVITDLSSPTYTYLATDNESDNGGVYNPDLKFKVFQVDTSNLFSPFELLITNE